MNMLFCEEEKRVIFEFGNSVNQKPTAKISLKNKQSKQQWGLSSLLFSPPFFCLAALCFATHHENKMGHKTQTIDTNTRYCMAYTTISITAIIIKKKEARNERPQGSQGGSILFQNQIQSPCKAKAKNTKSCKNHPLVHSS